LDFRSEGGTEFREINFYFKDFIVQELPYDNGAGTIGAKG
jgi:hypothetical protein